jgi:TonB family protein
MNPRFAAFMMLVGTAALAAADDKGFCPPTPPKPKVVATQASAPPAAPTSDATYAGTVLVMAVISDKGYVCDAKVLRGLDKETDKKAARAVRQWRFQPTRTKDGHPVPVVVSVEVNYWRKDGQLVQFPTSPTPTPTKDFSAH